MVNSTCKFDFDDFFDALHRFRRDARREVEKIGREAVRHAVENGDYHNVTGKCRASNRYEVDADNNLTLYNDCGYADELEANGKDVISGAALFAEERLREKFSR